MWTSEHEAVFVRCKELLTSNYVLALYDPSKEIIIYCDASPYGVGAVLTQIFDGIEKPVYFVSSTLSPAEKNYSQVHREALALVYSVKKFHKYIYGRQFTIRTDCQALREIFSAKNMPPVAAARLQRWNVFLSMYQYKIEYKSARCMANADGLSRLPLKGTTEVDGGCINVLKVAGDFPITTIEVRKATNSDQTLQRVKGYVLNGWPQKPDENIKHYFIKRNCLATEDDCLFYGERILIPFAMRKQVLALLHDTHVGMVRMKALARTYVYWPGIDIDIENWCKCCKACQSMQNRKDESELSSWPKTMRPFERVHIDFYSLEGKTFLILIDTYSLWMEIFPMKKTTAQDIIIKFRSMFSVFGLPDEIVSDNGPPFNSKEFSDFCTENGIKLSHSPAYSPQSNGQAEVAVRVAKTTLKKLIVDEKTKNIPIDLKLTNFLLKYRTTPTIATGKTPSSMLFSFAPKTLMDLINDKRIVREVSTKPIVQTQKRSQNMIKQNEFPSEAINQRIDKKVEKYEVNEIVSYQIVWKNIVKWVPAKIIGKISECVYVVSVNGASKSAHLRQIRKTTAENLNDWPGVFTHRHNNDEDREGSIRQKRPRSPDSIEPQIELRRSERLAKVPRRNYRV